MMKNPETIKFYITFLNFAMVRLFIYITDTSQNSKKYCFIFHFFSLEILERHYKTFYIDLQIDRYVSDMVIPVYLFFNTWKDIYQQEFYFCPTIYFFIYNWCSQVCRSTRFVPHNRCAILKKFLFFMMHKFF